METALLNGVVQMLTALGGTYVAFWIVVLAGIGIERLHRTFTRKP